MMHVSVLLDAAIDYLAIRPDGTYVDATFGAGGHSMAILSHLHTGRLIALDADPDAIARAQAITDPSFTFVHANFSELRRVLNDCGVEQVDGVLFDLGVSSMQLDNAERGFSFRDSAPLDMRMNPYHGRSAYDILATASERELADIFFNYGEERAARRDSCNNIRANNPTASGSGSSSTSSRPRRIASIEISGRVSVPPDDAEYPSVNNR